MSHASGPLSPSPTHDITIVYQRQGALPQEIHLLPVPVSNASDPQTAYSRFKTSVCRLFQLPKATPFMLKDTVSGAKMTRDRFSEYLSARAFPLVWRLITALPGEDPSGHGELQSQSSCSLSETHSLHSLARSLSLGWNDNTNSYGLETQCIQVPFLERQLVFVCKRAQSLALAARPLGQTLSVGDLILKIDSRPVEDMSREEVCLHLEYPQADLAPLSLLVLPWTDAPQQLKDLILGSLRPLDPEPLPSTSSEPCFRSISIPVTPIDGPLSPCTSPRKRKSRHPFSTGSPADPGPGKSSPAKKMGLLTGTRPRLRASSVSRSDSFSFIPSCPPGGQLTPCTPEERAVFSPSAPEPSHTPLKLELTLMNPELTLSLCEDRPPPADPEPELTEFIPELIRMSADPEETLVPLRSEIPADANPELTLISFLRTSELEPSFPAVEPEPEPGLSYRYSRSVSDPKANRIIPAELSSSSSDLDTECATGMYTVSPARNGALPFERRHHYETLEDTFEPPRHKSASDSKNKHSDKLDSFRKLISGARSDSNTSAPEMPRVSDASTTIVSACTEFVNPSFQGPVHGVYRSFDLNIPDRRASSHIDTMDLDLYTHTKSTNEISYFSSTDDSEGEEGTFPSAGVPIGLITPVRPRKLRPPDGRPVSDLIPRSTSDATNLAGAARFFEEADRLSGHRVRMVRKQKTMLLSPGPLSPSPQVPNGAPPPPSEARPPQSTLYSGKPAEFTHPAYRPYQPIGNMEISERMCAKLRDKFQPISCGPLARKHEFDGRLRRRATDRSWKSVYVQLLASDLIFYRSERDYAYDKPFLKSLHRDQPDRHFLYDHIVSLHHAKLYIPNDYMALKRNCTSYVFRIETENTSAYLIRAVSLPLMFGWILSFVEARVLPPTDHPHSTGLFQFPDKRRKTTIEGANRYLQRIQQKMKSRLNFARRDSDTASDPIFAPSIARCLRARGNDKVPLLVEMCVREVEDRALESEGIYRVSGTARQIRSLKEDLARGAEPEPEDERWLDANNIAGLFKLFFKELTEPLVCPQVYDQLISAVSQESDSQGQLIRDLQRLVQALPEINLSTLDYVVAHLCRVAQVAHKNRMSVRNLAIVFGPTLITRRDLTSIELIHQTNFQVCVMEQLILSYEHIFSCAPIPDALFDSKRAGALSSHAIVRSARSSNSAVGTDRVRRVSSTEPPVPCHTPPAPYPPHPCLENKLSRSWSEEVLSRASLIGEAFGSDLFRTVPLHSLLEPTASTLPPRLEYPSHPLSNAQWYLPPLPPLDTSLDRGDSK